MSDDSIKKGTKITPEDAAKMDRNKMGVAVAQSPKSTPEVEGQYLYRGIVECPWCYSLDRCVLDSNQYNWYTCGACGGAFSA